MNERLTLTGKVALVTGASSGLGAHFSRVLAKAGAKVWVTGRRQDNLDRLAGRISSDSGEVLALRMDVTDQDSIDRAITESNGRTGPITVLVNNAGVAYPDRFVNATEEDWDKIMDTNLKGVWRVSRAVCRNLLDLGLTGSIVNIASILGLRPGFGDSSYAISKAGVIHMTRSMALELCRKGIRVNAICPGYFKSEMNAGFLESPQGKEYIRQTPAMRTGELHELDIPLLMLASDAGSYVNGAILPVDGGHLLKSL